MKRDGEPRSLVRTVALAAVTWVALAAWWLLLVDLTATAELVLGAATATAGAIGVEVARRQAPATEIPRPHWLLRMWRPLLALPRDAVIVSGLAIAQLVRPKRMRGRFRAIPFDAPADDPHDRARRGLAESAGSFAPNTIVLGVDRDSGLLLAHQLQPAAQRDLDPLELG